MSEGGYKVLVTDYVWPSLDPERQVLSPIHAELVASPSGAEDVLAGLAGDADAILTCFAKVTPKVIEAAKNCKIIARYGIGVDNIDLDAATAHGIVVTNVPEYCVEEVATHALALVLALARKVVWLDRAMRAGTWDIKSGGPITRVARQKLGMVGFGKIGRSVVAKARALGFKVLVYDPVAPAAEVRRADAEPVDFPTLLSDSDFISIHCPLTNETRHLFGEAQFHAMKPTAFIVNTARGPVVDNVALAQAIREGRIAGAGLDVLEDEPPRPDNPLFKLDRVIVTPHAAFYSEESLIELQTKAAQEVARVLSGRRPLNVINPEVLADSRLA